MESSYQHPLWYKVIESATCWRCGSRCFDRDRLSHANDVNISKFAIDNINHTFTRELVNGYKLDFNFVDEKDGKTLLDYVQERINEQKRMEPPSLEIIRDYENLYKGIVRNGGKHKKDLKPEEY